MSLNALGKGDPVPLAYPGVLRGASAAGLSAPICAECHSDLSRNEADKIILTPALLSSFSLATVLSGHFSQKLAGVQVQISFREGTLRSLLEFWDWNTCLLPNLTPVLTKQIAKWKYGALGAGVALTEPRLLNLCVYIRETTTP